MKYFWLYILFVFPISLFANDSITVYLFLAEDCPICRYYTLDLNQLYEEYANEDLGFMGLFPNRSSTERKIEEFREKFSIAFPLKREYLQMKARELGVTVTPEVVVVDEVANKVLYRGRIDNTYARLGRKRPQATERELREVLTAINNKQPIPHNQTTAVGCFITFID